MKIAVLPGALRSGSFNKQLARNVCRILDSKKIGAQFLDLKTYEIPVYDGDLESEKGIPPGVTLLNSQIMECDALIVVTPEYNGSIPGVLKNTVDWLSRIRPCCLGDKNVLIMAASPGGLGGVRSLWHSRVPFEVLNSHVYPEMFGLSKANEAFDENGKLKDPRQETRVNNLVTSFIQFVEKQQS